jgi:hypothetical protein
MNSYVNAYGSFFSIKQQVILVNNNIEFDEEVNVLNLVSNLNNIKILFSGIYLVHFIAYFDQPCQLAIFINDKLEETSIIACNTENNCITIHHIYKLNENDTISIKNYVSYGIITTSINGGLIPQSKNVELSIHRIN